MSKLPYRRWIWAGLLPFVVLVAFVLIFGEGRAADPTDDFHIVGYLPEYRLKRFDPVHAAQATDVVLFAAEPAETGEISLAALKDVPWAKLRAFQQKHDVRILLCVGGWGHSSHFSTVVADDQRRRRFVRSAVSILRTRKLNGLDIDWEHPKTAADNRGYTRLLTELRTAFAPYDLTLSLTIAPWQKLPADALAAADRVQLMSYDYGQRHSTLEQAKEDVRSFIEQGVPAEKIVLGMPFYGRDIDDRSKALTFSTIAERYGIPPNSDEIGGYFFNGPRTIRQKTQFALETGLEGVMVWELGQDLTDERSLLRAIQQEVDAAE